VRQQWDVHKGKSVDTKPFDVNAIDGNPELPMEFLGRITASTRKCSVVFEGNPASSTPTPKDIAW
jgi:hypothetical protein